MGIPYGSTAATCPVRALNAWKTDAGIADGPLFRGVDRHGHIGSLRLHKDSVGLIDGAIRPTETTIYRSWLSQAYIYLKLIRKTGADPSVAPHPGESTPGDWKNTLCPNLRNSRFGRGKYYSRFELERLAG